MNQVLQPHESHVPFHLQFMMDHNLYGMNHIHVSAVRFRVSGSFGNAAPYTVHSVVIVSNFLFQRMIARKRRCRLPLGNEEGDLLPLLSSLPSLPRPVPPFSSTPVRVCGMSTHCQGSLFFSPLFLYLCYPHYFYSITSDLILCEPRKSVTELEADILAADILNRHELSLGRPTQSNPPSQLTLP